MSVGPRIEIAGQLREPDVIGLHAGHDFAADLPYRCVVEAEKMRLDFFFFRTVLIPSDPYQRDITTDVLPEQLLRFEQLVFVVLLEDAHADAVDIVCERKQTDFQKIAANLYEVEYEITLRNHKPGPVSVEVNEPIGGTWRMLQSSHMWAKTSVWAAQFAVPVATDGAATLKFRVRVTY